MALPFPGLGVDESLFNGNSAEEITADKDNINRKIILTDPREL